MSSLWKIIVKVMVFVVGGYTLLYALIMLFFLVFAVTTCSTEWSHSQEVYLRNRTASPLLVTLTVPRSALQVDTVWWGAPLYVGDYKDIGYALRVIEMNADGLRYRSPVSLPVLVKGAADTLELQLAGGPFAWPTDEPWLTRQQQAPPSAAEFAHWVALYSLPTSPDSVRLTFPLAPDSTFLAASRSLEFRHSDPDITQGYDMLLHLTVQWTAPTGQRYTQQVPAAYWLHRLDAEGEQRHSNTYHLKHFINYQ